MIKMKRPAAHLLVKDLKRRKVDKESLGLIISVTLRNFMCHENLHFDLDPHLNFITGRNGSGKSAVLTGIILGLGGKSSTTGRFGNIKGFVKTGKNKATIMIQLRNVGGCAYKPEEYGDKIIVEREISKEGSSLYKLKSSGGRIVSNQKEELKNILICMDIQIENPVTILTQENSRTFLTSKCGKSDKLFNFFFKGTGLEALQDNYFRIKNKKQDSETELNNKFAALSESEREIQLMKKNMGGAKQLKDLKKELLWAAVAESEKKLAAKQSECLKMQEEIRKIHEQIDTYQDHRDRLTNKLDEARKSKTESSNEAEKLRRLFEGKKAERETVKAKKMKIEGDFASLKRNEEKQTRDINELENLLNENKLKKQNDIEEEQRARDENIQELERGINQNISLIKKMDILKEATFKEEEKYQSKLEDINAETGQLKHHLDSLEIRVKQVQMALRNKLNLFGDKTTNVLEEISRRRNEFIQEPKGPIGQFITSKDSRWNSAIEACLTQHLLRSYCCDNHQDAALLRNILVRHYQRNMPGIITSKYLQRVHDVRQKKAHSAHPTVLDMLKINDAVIANSLIDQVGIENIILMEDRVAAVNEMLHKPPPNCKSGYLMNCDQICLNPYRMYSNTRPIQRSLLEAVQENEVGELLTQRSQTERRLAELNKERVETINLRKEIPSKLSVADRQIAMLQRVIEKNKMKILELSENVEQKDVLCLEQDLNVLRSEYLTTEKAIKFVQSALTEAKEEFKNLSEQGSEIENSLKEENAKFSTYSNEFMYCNRKLEILAAAKAKYDAGLYAIQKELNSETEKMQNEENIVEETRVKAISVCKKRIETDRSSESIRIQIEKLEKEISRLSRCDFTDLEENYNSKVRKYTESKRDLQIIKNNTEKLDIMLSLRQERYETIKDFTQKCIDNNFTSHLSHNHFEGGLVFSDEKQMLAIDAKPIKVAGGTQRAAQLSGGERSFVTISFILALWNWIHMPFRILDEYDVFMDSNNRQLSIDLLVETAKAHECTQYIFLSPLELPDISKHGIDYKVHQMIAPERQELTN